MEYLVEQLDGNGHWFIIGRDNSSVWAQQSMRVLRCMFPDKAFRVVEYPSRRLIVCEGVPAFDDSEEVALILMGRKQP